MTFEPKNPNFETKIRNSFSLQTVMETLGMDLADVSPGQVEIMLTKNDRVVQQQGFVHGGVMTSGLDSACGYAALTLAPETFEVMTIELKTSFYAPGSQEKILFVGTVLKPGRRVIFTEGEALGVDGDKRILLAKMSATMTYVDM